MIGYTVLQMDMLALELQIGTKLNDAGIRMHVDVRKCLMSYNQTNRLGYEYYVKWTCLA